MSALPELPEYDDRDPDNGPRWLALMPFLCVDSVNGPFDDKAFVAGVQLGWLDAELATPGLAATSAMLYDELEEQADLVAMRHGLTTDVLWRDDGWIHVGFKRAAESGDNP